MRILKWGFWWLLVPVFLLVLSLLLLLFTTSGARFAASMAELALPSLTIRNVDGSVIYGLRAEEVVWTQPEVTVTLQGLASVWDPRCLLQARICVDSLVVGRLHILVPEGDATDGDDNEPVTPIDMPLLVLPWRLQVDQFHLALLEVAAGGRTTVISPVAFQAEWSGSRVAIERLHAAMVDPDVGTIDASLSGAIDMYSEWPFNAILNVDYTPPLEGWQRQSLAFSGEGNIRNLLLQGETRMQVNVPDFEPLNLLAILSTQHLDSEIQLESLQGQWQGAPLAATGKTRFSHDGLLEFDNLQLGWGNNRATLNGALQDDWKVQAALQLNQPELLAPDARGQFTGSADISGRRDDPLVQLQLGSEKLELPQLQLFALKFQAEVAPLTFSSLNMSAQAKQIQVQDEKLEDIAVLLSGTAAKHHLSIEARRQQRQISAIAEGALDPAAFDWKGQLQKLQVQLAPDWTIKLDRAFALQWRNHKQILQWGENCLKDQDSQVCSHGSLDFLQQQADVALQIHQFNLGHLPSLLSEPWLLAGRLNADLHIASTFTEPQVKGKLDVEGLMLQPPSRDEPVLEHGMLSTTFEGRQAWLVTSVNLPPGLHWQSDEPVGIQWRKNGLQMDHSCWRANRVETDLAPAADLGQLCLEVGTGPNGLESSADLDLAVASALRPWLPEQLQVDGRLKAHADVFVKGSNARGSLQAALHEGVITLLRGEENEPLPMSVEALKLTAHLEDQALSAQIQMQSSRLGNGQADMKLLIDAEQPKMQLQADLNALNLEVVQPLVPQLSELGGTVGINIRAEGLVTAPAIQGQVDIQNVTVQSASLPMGVDDLDVRLVFTGDHGDLSGELRSGKGSAKLDGDFQRQLNHWQARLHLLGKNIPVYQPPDIRFSLQPDLTLLVDENAMQIQGTVLANDGFLFIKPLPPDAINVSSDVEFVDEKSAELQQAAKFQLGVNVVASVEPSLRIRGFGAEVRPKGAIRVNLDPAGIVVGRGTIDIEEGSYTGYGQQLNIRKGQAIFNGPLDQPYINLEAVREVDTVVAGIRVSGPASEPVATLFSEPTLPDSNILFYIITGKAPGAATEDENTAVRSALLSVGLMGGQPLARDIASKVGIDDLQMGTTGSGDETAVTVGGYINSRTYLQYGISVFEPVNTLTVRYRLRDNLFLEAVNGIASALDVLYSFEF